MFPTADEQLERIRDGVSEIIPESELLDKLERSIASGEPLIVKQGFDPTRPDLHIGHAISIHKLRTFQELGHRVVFVIGDFTALVGDPSGRSDTRPMLTREEIEHNLRTYEEQVFGILDPELTEIRRNSEWLSRLDLEDVLRLTAGYTVARMLERDDFADRFAAQKPITLVEFLYPMMQAYDSIALEADVELGGTDQKFNLLLGRTLQERVGQEPQVCILLPLLRGTDGTRKMSKSYDNTVGLTDEPADMFGRTMSIPDAALTEWIELVSGASRAERAERIEQVGTDPLSAKRWLAGRIVGRYHDETSAERARDQFDRLHRTGGLPDEIETVNLAPREDGTLWIARALVESGLAGSTSEARRLIDQGGVRVDGEPISDPGCHLPRGSFVVQRGKRRFVRVEIGDDGSGPTGDGPAQDAG
ncbi:MAG: tyrosine--tRNA ligase [marine benthic group bacterium]|nr:tyrosine--tRNA ligase [Gemmatimonadota bacterium]